MDEIIDFWENIEEIYSLRRRIFAVWENNDGSLDWELCIALGKVKELQPDKSYTCCFIPVYLNNEFFSLCNPTEDNNFVGFVFSNQEGFINEKIIMEQLENFHSFEKLKKKAIKQHKM